MTNWSSNNIDVNGINIHYRRSGGDKPALVMSHGLTDNSLCWIRLAQALEGAYDLIMPDARGHGLSDKPAQGYALADHTADLVGLIEALDLDKPALIGHSMGGAIVAAVAATQPQLTGCAILEDPPWFVSTTPASPESHRADYEAWRSDLVAGQSRSIEEIAAAGRQENPDWDDIEFAAWAESKLQVSPDTMTYIITPQTPWQDLASRLTVPSLLISADPEAGAIVSPEVAQIAAANPLIQTVHLPGAGHNIRREQFEAYLNAVTTFLSQIIQS